MIVASAPFEKVSLVILKYFILSIFFFFSPCIQLGARGPDPVHGNTTLCIVHHHRYVPHFPFLGHTVLATHKVTVVGDGK